MEGLSEAEEEGGRGGKPLCQGDVHGGGGWGRFSWCYERTLTETSEADPFNVTLPGGLSQVDPFNQTLPGGPL